MKVSASRLEQILNGISSGFELSYAQDVGGPGAADVKIDTHQNARSRKLLTRYRIRVPYPCPETRERIHVICTALSPPHDRHVEACSAAETIVRKSFGA